MAWVVVPILALLPLALVAILGSHGRMMGDDFCHLVSGLEYGPWGNLLFWRDSLNGSFSYYFLHGLVAPLETQATSVFVIIVIVVWLFGLGWLIVAGHRLFGLARPPLAIVIAIAAALVWLSIHGLVTPLSIYFYSALTRHTLPVAIFALTLAAGCEMAPRARSRRRLAAACAVVALIVFINAGMSEVFGTVQLALFTLILPASYKLVPRDYRRKCLALGMSAWAATVAALSVMATAPGVFNRLMRFGPIKHSPIPIHVDRIPETFAHIQAFISGKDLLTAFIGALAIGLCTSLLFRRPAYSSPIRKPFQVAAPPLLLCILAQLLLLPLVWGYLSDNPPEFGQFRQMDTIVVGAQVLLLASLVALCLARQKLNAFLAKKPAYWAAVPALTLGAVFMLYGLSQVGPLSLPAATIVACSLYTLLFALLWQFHLFLGAAGINNRFFAAFNWVFAVMGLSTLAQLFLNQAVGGMQYTYNLTFMSFSFVVTGIMCGVALAYAISQANVAVAPARRPTRAFAYSGAIIAAAIWFGISLANTRNITQFERFSHAWDERHQLILAKYVAGERLEDSPRLADEILEIPGGFWGHDYWNSYCGSQEISALIRQEISGLRARPT